MKEKIIGTVIAHKKPKFIEFQFMIKRDFNNGSVSEGTSSWFIPVIEYEVAGQKYTYCPRVAYRGLKTLDIGQSVELKYKSNHPEKCKIKI